VPPKRSIVSTATAPPPAEMTERLRAESA
jgi:hypothetical protein